MEMNEELGTSEIRVLFVHHSIGRRCLRAGLRAELKRTIPQLALWDLDYARLGLRDGNGRPVSTPTLRVPDDNTNPDGLLAFARHFVSGGYHRHSAEGTPRFSGLILKSCYTGSRIRSDPQADRYRAAAEQLIHTVEESAVPTVLLTPIPDSPIWSRKTAATRARDLGFHIARRKTSAGVRVINCHDTLGDPTGHLAGRYRSAFGFDPHPNPTAIELLSTLITSEAQALWAA